MRILAACLSALAVVSSLSVAQVPVWTRQGTFTPLYLQALTGPLAVIGDVNGDGYEDLIQDVEGYITIQGVYVFSGRDGAILRIQLPFLPTHAGQTITRAGDMNGDGLADYAIGYVDVFSGTPTNFVQVRSASDDALLWQASGPYSDLYGWHIAGDLDTNGDGFPDLVVSAERENAFRGAIRVYSHTGALRYTIANLPGIFSLGFSVAAVGDINNDGCDDFAAGAVDNLGMVIVFSGLTGAELRRGYGDIDGTLGYSVTGCGDIDGDGVPDFAGGTIGGFGQRGMVRVFSGANASTIYTWYSPSSVQFGNGFGARIFGGSDVNRDGVPDVILANADYNPLVGSTMVAAYSGRDGSRLFLQSLAGVGDLLALSTFPDNPFPAYVTSREILINNFDVGRIVMNRASPPGVDAFGTACAGALAAAPKIGINTTPQATTRIHISGAPPGSSAILMLGLSSTSYGMWPLPFPLTQFGFPGCMLSTSIDAFALVSLGTTGNAAGYGFYDLPVPLAATGLAIHGQWLALQSGSAAPGGVTDALRWRL
jgi:hypothetical protein